MANRCKYKGCPYEAIESSEYCIFHSPLDKKSEFRLDKFNLSITNLLKKRHSIFEGFIFPGDYTYPNDDIHHPIIFNNAVFHGSLKFESRLFERSISFRGAKFHSDVDLSGARFKEGLDFNEAEFNNSSKADINATKPLNINLSGGYVEGEASFKGTKFTNCSISFQDRKFNNIIFEDTEFNFSTLDFSRCVFANLANFEHCFISSIIYFKDLVFSDDTIFAFKNHIFQPSFDKTRPPFIYFANIKFNPFKTYFETILKTLSTSRFANVLQLEIPIIIFRFCQLRDVYFSENDMSLFSFYKSPFFEEAHFVANKWESVKDKIPFPYKRRNLLLEDWLKDSEHVGKISRITKKTEFPTRYLDISELYRRMKAAADRGKDYQLASWFYFNEFEMKRRYIVNAAKNEPKIIKRIFKFIRPSKIWIYYLYRLFAGYGEKPFWSFIWLIIFLPIFSFLHLLNGFSYNNGRVIEEIFFNKHTFWQNLPIAFHCTIQHIIPKAYIPFLDSGFSPINHGFLSLILELSNTIVLLLLFLFIGIGLKRHFRRY